MPLKWIRITFMFVIKRIIHVELEMAAAPAVAGAICNRNTACRKFFYCTGELGSGVVGWWLVSPFIKRALFVGNEYFAHIRQQNHNANLVTLLVCRRVCVCGMAERRQEVAHIKSSTTQTLFFMLSAPFCSIRWQNATPNFCHFYFFRLCAAP